MKYALDINDIGVLLSIDDYKLEYATINKSNITFIDFLHQIKKIL